MSKLLLVPAVASKAMLNAGCDVAHGWPTFFEMQDRWEAMVSAIRLPAHAKSAAPEGYFWAPVDPTDDMLYAGSASNGGDEAPFQTARRIWNAMAESAAQRASLCEQA